MARKAKSIYDDIPDDIKGMTLEQLRAEDEYRNSPEHQSVWDGLVAAHDNCQAALSADLERGQHIAAQMVKLITARMKEQKGE